MSHRERPVALLVSLLACLAMLLACSLPARVLGQSAPDLDFGASEDGEADSGASPVPLTSAPEVRVVTHDGESFHVYSLDGSLQETRSAAGLGYARPNTAQAVGDSIYYVDSSGSSLGGVVRRVTAEGVESLDFTAAEDQDTLTFAVSDDERRIAWTHSFLGQGSSYSKLYVAGIDGSDQELIVENGPPYDQPLPLQLEAVRWVGPDVIYAQQITGIGGYILFFGWSSFYRYASAEAATTPLVPTGEDGGGPCWYTLSPDGEFAVGGCGADGMRERQLSSGDETAFPVQAHQGQQGGAAYSPSGERLAYAIAQGNPDDESGQVILRLNRGQDPTILSTQTPGYFERIQWVDEERMVVGYFEGTDSFVDLLGVDGGRAPIGDGRLIGLLHPAAAAAGDDLRALVDRGDLEVEDLTGTGEIAGPGIKVVVHNPGPADVVAHIPCGFIFEPGDAAFQRLMAVQEAQATVPAGGEATLTVYVVCIDSHMDTPVEGAGYMLGSMQTGQLLQLAQCACQQDLAGSLDPFAGMGVMTAGWMISEGKTFSEMGGEDSAGAMGDLLGPEGDQALSGIMDLLEQPALAWFDRCQIPVP